MSQIASIGCLPASLIGVGCNLFSGALLPKFVPSFSWGKGRPFHEHKLDKMIETAKVVMSRRGVEMDRVTEMMLRRAFALTAEERTKHKRKK